MLYYLEAVDSAGEHVSVDLDDSVDLTLTLPDLDEDLDPDDEHDADVLARTPSTHPVNLANSIGVDVNDDSIRLSISIGDPRGAVEMVLRAYVDEEGETRTILRVPDEDEDHVPLRRLYGGTFEVGAYPRREDLARDEEISMLRDNLRRVVEGLDPEDDPDAVALLLESIGIAARLDEERTR